MIKQTAEIFELLSKGGFISSDSTDPHIRQLYNQIDLETETGGKCIIIRFDKVEHIDPPHGDFQLTFQFGTGFAAGKIIVLVAAFEEKVDRSVMFIEFRKVPVYLVVKLADMRIGTIRRDKRSSAD